MQVFKLEKQGTIAPIGYHNQNPSGVPVQADKPAYYSSVELAEAALQTLLGQVPSHHGTLEYRIYNSHLGVYVLETIEVQSE